MDLFSWNCKGCGLSVRCGDTARAEGAEWMGHAVAQLPSGSRVFGHYDGYGRVGSYDAVDDYAALELWHRDCYEHAGRPAYSSPSRHASDQGYFSDRWPKSRADAGFIAPEERDRHSILQRPQGEGAS